MSKQHLTDRSRCSQPLGHDLSLQLIGPVRLLAGGRDVTPNSRKAQALLGLLALSPAGPVARRRAAELLWERAAPEQARTLLRGVLHEIRKSVGDAAPDLIDAKGDHLTVIEATRDHLTLRRDGLSIDTEALVREGSLLGPDRPAVMEGYEAIGAGFQAWLASARATLAQQALPPRLDEARPVEGGTALVPVARASRRAGVRIGVGAIRSVGAGEDDPLAFLLGAAITDALAHFRWMSVVSVETADADMRRGLDLDYVVNGQVFHDGARLRLRISLVDVRQQSILMTFKSDRTVADTCVSEEELAAQIAASVDAHVQVVETHRALSSPSIVDAHGLLMRASALVCQLDQPSFEQAGWLLDRAVELEPSHVSTRIGRAQFQMIGASQGWLADPVAARARAEHEASLAMALDPFEARSLSIAGYVRGIGHRQPDDADELHRRALALNPNSPFALHSAAVNDMLRGDREGARARLERHRQLVAPMGQHLFVNSAVALLHLLDGNYEKVVQVSRSVLSTTPGFAAAHKVYLTALGYLGATAEARGARDRLLGLDPGFTIKGYLAGLPFRRAMDGERIAGGLRRAGLS